MTYKEAYEKIIQAYFKDEIRPMEARFCFCGTLCGNDSHWFYGADIGYADSHGYTGYEFSKMEDALFGGVIKGSGRYSVGYALDLADEEDRLFSGMCAALGVLKEIHRSRGENVDEVPEFQKRKLLTTERIKP